MRIPPVLAILLLQCLQPLSGSGKNTPGYAHVTLSCPGSISCLLVRDVDADGRPDIIVSRAAQHLNLRTRRSLCIFFQDSDGFAREQRELIPADQGEILWDIADIDLDGTFELLFHKTDGLYLSRRRGGAFELPARQIIKDTSVLPAPGSRELPRFSLTLPADSLTPPEVITFSRSSINIYRRHLHSYVPAAALYHPYDTGFTSGADLRYGFSLPVLTTGNFTGSLLSDIILISRSSLNVFFRYPGHTREAQELTVPDLRYMLQSRAITHSVFEKIAPAGLVLNTADLDGDGLLDVILGKAPMAGFSTGISQVQMYLNRDGRIGQLPDQILTADNFGGDHIITDLNKDGLKDIALLTYPLGFTQAARFLLTKRTANSYEIFLGRPGGTYPDMPDSRIEFTRAVALDNPLDYSPLRSMEHDFTGDGIADFLVAADRDACTVFPGTGEGSFTKDGSFRIACPAAENLYVTDLNADGLSDLILWSRGAAADPNTVHLIISRGGAAE